MPVKLESDLIETCPRLVMPVETPRITKLHSVNRRWVGAEMLKNASYGIDPAGNVYPTSYVDPENPNRVPDSVEDAGLLPISPYGPLHLMEINWQGDRPIAWTDIKPQVLRTSMAIQSRFLESIGSNGLAVIWGTNLYGGNLEGKGGQSVLTPHVHAYQNSENVARQLTHTQVVQNRNRQIWDGGPSEYFGWEAGKRQKFNILPSSDYGKNAVVRPDRMGYTTQFPGLTPAVLRDPHFIDSVIRPTMLDGGYVLDGMHTELYKGSRLKDPIDYVARLNSDADVDWDAYNNFFQIREPRKGEPGYLQRMRELDDAGELRKGFGWTIAFMFTDEGALMMATGGIANCDVGPVEGTVVGLIRPADPVSQSEMTTVAGNFRSHLKPALQAVS